MLQLIRDRAQGVVAWIIVILIIIPFALWGVNQYVGGGDEPVAATVNGEDITESRVKQAYEIQRQRLQQMFGSNFRPELFPEEAMKRQALESLVQRELMLQASSAAGLHIADEQLSQAIGSIDAFKKDGSFSNDEYRNRLAREGMSPAYFEQQVRFDMVIDQLQRGVQNTAFATDAETQARERLLNQSRDFGYLRLSLAERLKSVSLEEGEVQAFYDDNRERFMAPEQVAIDYLELSLNTLAAEESIDDEALRARYQSNIASYSSPEERHARHILVMDEGRLDEVKAKLDAGGDFAALAKEYSEDPGSAAQGGDLGFFGRGVMDPAFEEAAFALSVGEVSAPVKSAFGWHLIKLDAVKGGEKRPFESVKAQIRSELQREKAEQRYFEMAEQLANLTYEQPDSLEPAAAELGLTIQHSELFARSGGPGIAQDARVRDAAFSDEVKVDGLNSQALELSDGRMLVLRLADHQPAQVRPLDEVREAIAGQLKRNKAAEQLDALAAELETALQEGAKAGELAKANGSEWVRLAESKRDDRAAPQELVAAAFRLPRPADSKPASQVILANGDRAVVMLYAVNEGEADGEADGELLRKANAEAAVAGLGKTLRQRSEVKVR